MDKWQLVPGKVVLVDHVPQCDFCEEPGPYDFKTMHGPWAHGCHEHFNLNHQYDNLGVGKAQFWVTSDQVEDALEQ